MRMKLLKNQIQKSKKERKMKKSGKKLQVLERQVEMMKHVVLVVLDVQFIDNILKIHYLINYYSN